MILYLLDKSMFKADINWLTNGRENHSLFSIPHMKASLYTEYRERTARDLFERTLHRNMLLPFVSIPEPEQKPQTVRKVRTCPKPSQNSGSDSDSSSNSDSCVQLYRNPQRRNPNT
ncbi:hypothetical protein DPMN_107574 [Dreissena polymorpha]|uniref:Uncharacterized protein n=1 Tax=Dreissena polymorpha TaxID=45954 RepID=A0A9D4QKA8_DREPO|nr:hypothetical protein DPMN_107574 [Dreissena polymorpha]